MESTTSDPIEILLNTEDHDHRDELTKQWRDHKLAELNFVGVVVSSFILGFNADLLGCTSSLLFDIHRLLANRPTR